MRERTQDNKNATPSTPYLCSEGNKLCKVSVIEVVQHPHVLAVAKQPVDGREMLSLGKFLVQAPKYL